MRSGISSGICFFEKRWLSFACRSKRHPFEIRAKTFRLNTYREMVDTINISGKRLLHTLNLILELSREEANRQEIKTETLDLVEFSRSLVRLFEINTLKKGLYLNFVANLPHIHISTDNRLLEHVLNDLINNAIKYTERVGVTVSVDIVKEYGREIIQI